MMLVISVALQSFAHMMNTVSDKAFGTNYNNITNEYNPKRRVRFTKDEVVYYRLTPQERNMKRMAYKKIRIQSKHYIRMDRLRWTMEGMKLSD